MNFDVGIYGVIPFGNNQLLISETLVNTWIVMAILIIFAVIVRIKFSSFSEKPTGFQNFVELLVETFDNFVLSTAGKKLSYLSGWFFTVFLFVGLSNIIGLIPLVRPPTADWTATLPLGVVTFLMIQGLAFYYTPKDHAKGFLEPIFLFLPLNILGELAKPISLSFRLFGNVLGGMILLTMVYSMAPVPVWFVAPIALHAYFDLASGLLQAYVFVVLSLAFTAATANPDGV